MPMHPAFVFAGGGAFSSRDYLAQSDSVKCHSYGRQYTFLMLAWMSLEAFDAEALTRGTDMLGVCTSVLPLPCMSRGCLLISAGQSLVKGCLLMHLIGYMYLHYVKRVMHNACDTKTKRLDTMMGRLRC